MIANSTIGQDVPAPGTDVRAESSPRTDAVLESDRITVLPLLCTHLTETAKQVETSVVAVCGNFQRMAERAQESVARADDVLGGRDANAGGRSGARSIRTTSEAAETTLNHLLERITHSSESSMHAAAEMERLQRSMRSIESVLDEVDRLASSTRFLALNASIEAARAGAHGQAFGVVAKEMARMAVDSRRTSEAIRAAVSGLIADIGGLSGQLTELASADLENARTSRTDVEGAIATLTDTNQRLHDSIEESARSSEALAGDITAAVVALQFQDSVSQRIGHVVAALETMSSFAGDPAQRAESLKDTLRLLRNSYTMETERQLHALHTGEPVGSSHSAAGSVELF